MDKDKTFYSEGLYFECQRCSYCCGHSPGFVYLSKNDMERLRSHFDIPLKEFVEKYCRWADYYYGKTVLALFEKKNYDCVLWNNGCSAYEARPLQCSTYPFWTWMVADKETWCDCGKDCPGINKGKLWSKDEIEACTKAYDANEPITKEEVESLIALEVDK